MNPKVSFIVPCYRLAHLLPECVNSILAQTYGDFEVLIMDDCSPDNTPEVARSFADPRVKHVRNDPNLGHLRNYNKGIELSRGEYIWLISADDSLRSSHVLERYVKLMDASPNVGFTFCPAMKVVDAEDHGVMRYSLVADHDTTIPGHQFLSKHLVYANIVPSPAAMARKKLYESVNGFPLDLPHTGDWYLWGMFAFAADVGFFAESMVNRRFHERNMSSEFCTEAALAMFRNNLAAPLRFLQKAEREGLAALAEGCRLGVAAEYLRQLTPPKPGDPIQTTISEEEFEESLESNLNDNRSRNVIRAYVYERLADEYVPGDQPRALRYYRLALRQRANTARIRAKYALARMGAAGKILRESFSSAKHFFGNTLSMKV